MRPMRRSKWIESGPWTGLVGYLQDRSPVPLGDRIAPRHRKDITGRVIREAASPDPGWREPSVELAPMWFLVWDRFPSASRGGLRSLPRYVLD